MPSCLTLADSKFDDLIEEASKQQKHERLMIAL
jgi:hypothetical protein